MSRWKWAVPVILLVVLLVAASLSEPGHGASSVLSRGPDGWYAFRAVLQSSERSVELSKEPWSELFRRDSSLMGSEEAADSALVVAFPWQRFLGAQEPEAVNRFLSAGGTVWVGYSGEGTSFEQTILEQMGAGPMISLRSPAPLSPREWWRHQTARWSLHSPEAAGFRLEVPAFDYAPEPPVRAEVHYRFADLDTGSGEPPAAIFSFERRGGRVVMFPAALGSNAEILTADNLAWLNGKLGEAGVQRWWIDEYHHGSVRPDLVREASYFSWDTFMLHLLVIYLLGIWALARRFGPVWLERPARFGSTAEFLQGIGVLHHRLGHHRDAAVKMRERVADLYPRAQAEALPDPSAVDDGQGLVDFAKRVSRYQSTGAETGAAKKGR